jgi:hypothetical protein
MGLWNSTAFLLFVAFSCMAYLAMMNSFLTRRSEGLDPEFTLHELNQSVPIQAHRFPMLALDKNMWEGHSGKNVSMCIVVRTYAGHLHVLGALLASLAAAAHNKISIYLVDTGKHEAFTALPKIAKEFNNLVGFEMAKVSDRTSENSRPLVPYLKGFEDWGYAATDMVINDLLQLNDEAVQSGSQKPCMTLHFTNGDNLVGKSFFLATLDAIAQGHNLVATNFIHRGYGTHVDSIPTKSMKMLQTTSACGPLRVGSDVEVFSQWKIGCIDLGAAVINASLFEKGIRFVSKFDEDFVKQQPKEKVRYRILTTDGTTFHALASSKDANPTFIRRALMFHQ